MSGAVCCDFERWSGGSEHPALPSPWSPEPSAPPWPPGSSASPWLVGSPSPPRAPPPPAPPPLVGPLESAAITPPWLLPPSAPPWAIIIAVAWVLPGSSCSGSLQSPPWLLPPSSPPWSLSAGPLPGVRRPPEPPLKFPPAPPLWMLLWCEDAPSGRGAICHAPGLFCCVFAPHVLPVT